MITQHVDDVEVVKRLKHALPRNGRDNIADYPIVIENSHCLRLGGFKSSSRIALQIGHTDREIGFHPLENLVHIRLRNWR